MTSDSEESDRLLKRLFQVLRGRRRWRLKSDSEDELELDKFIRLPALKREKKRLRSGLINQEKLQKRNDKN